jgi:hypothetical protein
MWEGKGLGLSIGYGYWLLIFTLKKCGYGYNPFWLLPIVHGYAYNPLAIDHWLWLLGIRCEIFGYLLF